MTGLVDTIGQWALAGGTAGGGFAAVRWGLGWVAARADRRQALLDAQEEKIDGEWAGIRQTLADRVQHLENTIRRMDGQFTAMRRAYQLVVGGLLRTDARAPELVEAEQILAMAIPLDFEVLTARAETALDTDQSRRGAAG